MVDGSADPGSPVFIERLDQFSESLILGDGGIEPPTSVLSGQRSTTELVAHLNVLRTRLG